MLCELSVFMAWAKSFRLWPSWREKFHRWNASSFAFLSALGNLITTPLRSSIYHKLTRHIPRQLCKKSSHDPLTRKILSLSPFRTRRACENIDRERLSSSSTTTKRFSRFIVSYWFELSSAELLAVMEHSRCSWDGSSHVRNQKPNELDAFQHDA